LQQSEVDIVLNQRLQNGQQRKKSTTAGRVQDHVLFVPKFVNPGLIGNEFDARPIPETHRAPRGAVTLALILVCAIVPSGCAFDVSYVKTAPAGFTPKTSCGVSWTLTKEESIGLGTGFPTRLHQGTRWRCVGAVEAGDVFRTDDQIVTVEASNIYEAMAVMSGGNLVGFYLPVERRIAPVTPPVPIQIKEIHP
jgi:hypothetical protein